MEMFKALIIALGCVAIGLAVRARQRSRRALQWPSVAGEIVGWQPTPGDGDDGHQMRIVYRYAVGGLDYQGSRLWLNPPPKAVPAERELLSQLTAGHTVPVYYDPANPADAVLDNRPSSIWREAALAGAGLIVFALAAL